MLRGSRSAHHTTVGTRSRQAATRFPTRCPALREKRQPVWAEHLDEALINLASAELTFGCTLRIAPTPLRESAGTPYTRGVLVE